jgi:RNA processing factor Prp31
LKESNLSLISHNEETFSKYFQISNKKGNHIKQDVQTFSNIYKKCVESTIDTISKYKECKGQDLIEMKEELMKIQNSFELTNKEITQTLNTRLMENKSNTLSISSQQLDSSKAIRSSLESVSHNINQMVDKLNSKYDVHFDEVI